MTSSRLTAVHGFTTRLGGVSEGVYASLNLGVNRGDDKAAVRENYRRIMAALGIAPGKLVFSHQVHKADIRPVTSADCGDIFDAVPYEADGLITNEKGLALIIFTADCIPILLEDTVTGAVGAVHAGWRGTALGIAREAVSAMAREYGSDPKNIRAAIGPGIGRCCFETGAEVPEAMTALLGARALEFINTNGEKSMVDLKAINHAVLISAGVKLENIDVSPECTKCSHEKYWSHRYTGGVRGSQASIIKCP
jgi:hypothetical protein